MSEYDDFLKWTQENTFITIYTYDELKGYIDESGVIKTPLEIRGLHITRLIGVKNTTQHFTLGDTEFEDLGELETIEGDFRIWNFRNKLKLHSLNPLKLVKGSVNLRYSKLNSLGCLNHIGGDLNLRDTNITDLSNILKIGGNLHLPKKYKSIIDTSHIEIGGKVKYWNESKNVIPENSSNSNLSNSEIEIPHWKFQYIVSYEQVQYEESGIQEFYQYFKKSFFEGIFIDVRGETNYLFTLLLELRDRLSNIDDYQVIKNYFELLSKHYPVLKTYTTDWIMELAERKNDYDYLKESVISGFEEYFNIYDLPRYFYLLNKTNDNKLDPNLFWKIISNSSLTNYGLENLNDVKSYFDLRVIESHRNDIISDFREYVKKWESLSSISNLDEKEIKKVISFFERELRESENDLRLSRGLPKIGEGWISETELFYHIRTEFSNLKVIHHGRPKWLGRQHLDIYIEDFNIGIEYQGKQHSQSVEYFGGDTSFTKQLMLDEKKKVICEENGCELIEVFPEYNLKDILGKISNIVSNRKTI
jgi:hypothetical protein